MIYHLRQAPDHFNVTQANRYSEVRGLGGDEPISRHLALKQACLGMIFTAA
jgi:hypothetical protein